jgi:hypothetical protein
VNHRIIESIQSEVSCEDNVDAIGLLYGVGNVQ